MALAYWHARRGNSSKKIDNAQSTERAYCHLSCCAYMAVAATRERANWLRRHGDGMRIGTAHSMTTQALALAAGSGSSRCSIISAARCVVSATASIGVIVRARAVTLGVT
jgi:hypothetical protein